MGRPPRDRLRILSIPTFHEVVGTSELTIARHECLMAVDLQGNDIGEIIPKHNATFPRNTFYLVVCNRPLSADNGLFRNAMIRGRLIGKGDYIMAKFLTAEMERINKSALTQLLATMDVPEKFKIPTTDGHLQWLGRNLFVRNRRHADFQHAARILKDLGVDVFGLGIRLETCGINNENG